MNQLWKALGNKGEDKAKENNGNCYYKKDHGEVNVLTTKWSEVSLKKQSNPLCTGEYLEINPNFRPKKNTPCKKT